MKRNLSKKEIKIQIEEFFKDIKNKSPREIKKIQRLAKSINYHLKDKRKLFCKKCLTPYSGKESIRIKNKRKIIVCENCDYVSHWKIKN